jgi:hypothetical protein
MNGKWFAVAIVLAGASAACGEGRLIFNVDVYSWLKTSAKDTIPYVAPPLTPSFSASNSAQKIDLVPGLGSSAIDTVKVTFTADVINQSGGPGSLKFQVYLAADSAGTYTAGRDSMFSPAPSVTIPAGASTQSLPPFSVPNLSPSGNALFSNSAIWIRFAATISNSSAAVMQGKAALTGLDLRVVVQDKFF